MTSPILELTLTRWEHWRHAGAGLLVIGFVVASIVVGTVVVITVAVREQASIDHRTEACANVLHCVDAGGDRSDCSEHFPGCEPE